MKRTTLIALPLALCMAIASLPAQQPSTTTPPAAKQSATGEKLPPNRDRRHAAKLFMQAGKLFMAEKFEEAMALYKKAAALDASNRDYALAIEVARNHAVTALVQSAAKDRLSGNATAAHAALEHARALAPNDPQVEQHLYELGNDQVLDAPTPLYDGTSSGLRSAAALMPLQGEKSFHLHADTRQIAQQIFTAYGIQVTIDDSVRSSRIFFDLDEVNFAQAVQAFTLATRTFYVPLDAHRALIARDSREARLQFENQELETITVSGMDANAISDLVNVAKNVFQIQNAVADTTASSITLRAAPELLTAFNNTLRPLLDGKSQVMLEVRILQLARNSTRSTGTSLPQTFTAANVYTEEQSILNANSTLVQEIISSGLASANDPLAIIGILIASGSVSSSLFSNGLLLFGGGITQSALSPGGSFTVDLGHTYSNSRQLDNVQLRLGDGEASTLRLGSRYPIQTSSYSNMSSSSSAIAGLTTSGTSSALAALLASYSSTATIPQVSYQDLGLTLKTTASVMRNDHLALSIELKIDALSGTTLNDNPILTSRSYSGVITTREGESVILAGELDKSETRSLSGTPGIGEIPGLNQIDDNEKQKNTSSLLILVTPHLVRGPQSTGHSPMFHIQRTGQPQ
jgi:Flp pilus assembly secretin CpaC